MYTGGEDAVLCKWSASADAQALDAATAESDLKAASAAARMAHQRTSPY